MRKRFGEKETMFSKPFFKYLRCLCHLTLYQTVVTFNDAEKEAFRKHCEKRRKCNVFERLLLQAC